MCISKCQLETVFEQNEWSLDSQLDIEAYIWNNQTRDGTHFLLNAMNLTLKT